MGVMVEKGQKKDRRGRGQTIRKGFNIYNMSLIEPSSLIDREEKWVCCEGGAECEGGRIGKMVGGRGKLNRSQGRANQH